MVKTAITALLSVMYFQLLAQSPANNELLRQIDKLVKTEYERGQFSGAVLVADQGEIILNKTYGFQDVEGTIPLNSTSVFEIASLTKSFTAMLVMIMVEEGKLGLDDKLVDHISGIPYDEITIRHLLSHTSGLSERQFFRWAGQNMDPGKVYHNSFVVDYLKSRQPALSFAPGTKWEYSNLGYMLLAQVLQEVSGKHYITLLNELILKPLEMSNTGIYSQGFKGHEMGNYAFSKIFNPKDSVFIPAFGLAWSDSLYGGVGILSDAADLLKWDQAMYTNELVDQKSLTETLTPQPLPDGSSCGYGLGWFIKDDYRVNGKSVGKQVSHYGLWPGYEASIVRYIDQKRQSLF